GWDKFIKKLSTLPPEIEVIAINDYLFLEGYKKVTARKSEIPNIKLIIPAIEFRLDTFSGTADNKKRHNFHVFFDPEIPTEKIEEQFLRCISKGYKLSDKSEWQENPTKTSLETLGKKIKAEAPTTDSIQSRSDLEVGFENITYNRKE
ncbi:MAG: hypothetical protein WC285_05975, partial [Candidatus Gracilibacteria bacterium]